MATVVFTFHGSWGNLLISLLAPLFISLTIALRQITTKQFNYLTLLLNTTLLILPVLLFISIVLVPFHLITNIYLWA